MARDAEALINSDEELSRLFGGRPTQYRKSKSLPKYTGEAARVCARINRIFFDDPGEAYRLFHELIPEAGEGVEFTPPFTVDYGIGLRIGRDTFINKDFINSLGQLLPRKAIQPVAILSGIPFETKINQITREQRTRLVEVIKALPVTPLSFRPIEEAIVTAGGVDVSQVNPKTMESKLLPGLYFAGEVLDVDGYTGGFNLQIAFSTAFAAGNHC